MNRYEVTYQQDGQVRSVIVEASGPVDAQNKFLAQHTDAQVTVLCVVRQ